MPLSIGELVGYLSFDDSGVDAGARAAEDRVRRLGGVVESEMDGVSRRMGEAGRRAGGEFGDGLANGAGDGAERAGDRAATSTDGWKGRVGVAAAGVGAAAGIGLSGALEGALSAEAALAKLQAQLGWSAQQASDAGALAGSVFSAGFGASLDDVNAAIAGVSVNMGVAIDDIDMEPLTQQALVLSDVFGVDLTESTLAAGNLMRNLGMDGTSALDAIGTVMQNGDARAADLLETLEEYPVQWQKLGLSGEQAMGMIDQGLKGNARNTDIVADALKEFSIRSVDGSKAAADSFAALGLNAEEMTATFARGGPEAAAALDTVFDRLRATEGQSDAATIAFGLFGTQSEDLGRALYTIDPSEATASLGEFNGMLQTAGATAADTAQGKIAQLTAQTQTLLQGVVELPGPLGTVAAGMMAFGPQAIGMAGSLAMVAMAIGPLLGQLLTLAVSAATTAASWAMSMLSMIANATMATGRVLLSLAMWVAGVIAQGAVAVASMAVTAAGYIASWLLMGVQAMARAAMMAAAWLIAMGPIGWVIAAVVGLVALIIANWDTIVAWTTQAWTAVSGFVSECWSFLTGLVSGATAAVVGFVTGAWSQAQAATSAAWSAVSGAVQAAWSFLTGLVSGAASAVVGFLSDCWSNAVRLASDAWRNIISAVQAGASNVINFVRGLPGQILSALGNLGNLLFNAGRSVVQGLWNGIAGMGQWLYGQIMGWVRRVVPGPILQFLGIASPSKFMRDQIGRWIPEGLADGIIGNAKVAGDAARQMAMSTAAGAQAALDSTGTLQLGPITAGTGQPGSRDTAAAQGGARVLTVTINNPVAEKASDTLGRRARTLAALGPFSGGTDRA